MVVWGKRISLPMQGTWVQFLIWEVPTCCGATEPMHTTAELVQHNYESPHA